MAAPAPSTGTGTAGTGASTGNDEPGAAAQPSPTTTVPDEAGQSPAAPIRSRALRGGEDRLTLTMAEPYTPSPPTGVGTDDYRCFLLDPGLVDDGYLTGTNVLPGNPDVVHHVILFRVMPDQVAEAERLDAATDGPGWTCFGGAGLSRATSPTSTTPTGSAPGPRAAPRP